MWGIKHPFKIGGNKGSILTSKDTFSSPQHTKECIQQMLTTFKLERVMEEGLFSDIRDYIFDEMDLSTQTLLAESVKKIVEERFNVVKVRRVTPYKEENKLFVDIEYELVDLGSFTDSFMLKEV